MLWDLSLPTGIAYSDNFSHFSHFDELCVFGNHCLENIVITKGLSRN